jgi:ribonuclease D
VVAVIEPQAPDAAGGDGAPAQVAARPVTPLLAPRDGVPPVADTPEALARVVATIGAASGPVAVDAERASGHRYGQRAFLVQLRRAGAGTALVDAAALPDLTTLDRALDGAPWVLHAASQDLPCLAELGLRPKQLFDTELGARLAGLERVGLAAVVEHYLGLSRAKEHSAVDWSTRPLPEPWLRYAALDVEVLLEVAAALEADLAEQGKLAWAQEEFAALATAPAAAPRSDPWRRTSGIHRIRNRRQLAAVRELWLARDGLARDLDVSPGRLLPDGSILAAAQALPSGAAALAELGGFTGRGSRRHLTTWTAALDRSVGLPDADLPPMHLPAEGPPPPRVWAEKDPAAALRLASARAVIAALAQHYGLPAENLVPPDAVRRLCWQPPEPIDPVAVSAELAASGARRWQRDLVVTELTAALLPRGERDLRPFRGLPPAE